MTNEEFKIKERTCRGMTNGEIAELVAKNCVKHLNVDFAIVFTASWTTTILKDNQLKDYFNGAIEAVKDCQPLVKMLNEMIKDLGL